MASKDAKQPIIVIKRIKKGHHAHHGGAWKIAYADFVTAMMAFFLLMWLLGSTSQGDLKGISDY
ncbi:MAG: flagellar motor protein MotB, partial [Usitatibacteraceae bacterium]